jgi:hypothetical protein
MQTSTETFFRTSKFYKAGDEAPPIFLVDGVSYLSVKVKQKGNSSCSSSSSSSSEGCSWRKEMCVVTVDYIHCSCSFRWCGMAQACQAPM